MSGLTSKLMLNIREVKSFAGIESVLKGLDAPVTVDCLRYNTAYHITIGPHDDNVFIMLDVPHKQFSACARVVDDESKNVYRLVSDFSGYLTNHGRKPLLNTLHK